MGGFSFLCKSCGKPLNSNGYSSGEECCIFLLKDSKVIESMTGQYGGYGNVFSIVSGEHLTWDLPWSEICDLMLHRDPGNGLAIYHVDCYTDIVPLRRSPDDPAQGSGDYTY